ncbi:JmjC domain [Trinorchestia longiramus]|nr:JmjC domain [Trinorchestia longiramus]
MSVASPGGAPEQLHPSDPSSASRFLDLILPLSDHGGWEDVLDHDTTKLAQPGPCTVDVRHASQFSQQEFLDRYAFRAPVVIIGASDNEEFKRLTSKPSLLSALGSSKVRLSSANTYSYDKRDVAFSSYCSHYIQPQRLDALANETFYLFGDHSHPDWLSLMEHYNIPPYYLPNHSTMLSFGVAGPGSGVPFHFHGPGFAETMWGRKRWFLAPPESVPVFNPNRTTLQWLLEDYPHSPPLKGMLECTLNPGELVYFPDRWWHATLNIDVCVFMSTFLSP